MKLVYATGNPGKFAEVAKLFFAHTLTLHSPAEYKVTLEVSETGNTLEENAILKAEAYRDALPEGCIVIGDDTGLEIDALGGEPGIHVRRWQGHRMTDEEIIAFCLKRMKDIPVGERGAQFRTVLAIANRGHPTNLFDGIYRGTISQSALPTRTPGFPFRSLFVGAHPTHRVHAVEAALPYLKKLLAQAVYNPGA